MNDVFAKFGEDKDLVASRSADLQIASALQVRITFSKKYQQRGRPRFRLVDLVVLLGGGLFLTVLHEGSDSLVT